MKKMGKQAVVAVMAPIGLAMGLALGAVQTADAGYLTTSRGEVVTNNYGECWTAVGGSDMPMVACGDVVDGDADGDGVPDSKDKCPNTPKGVAVNAIGCPLDSDGDGIPDYKDKCPGTRRGAKVNFDGCEIMADVSIKVTADHFDFDSAKLKPAMESSLDDVASKVKASPGDESLEVVGHTDSTGPDSYNQGLSERRAQAAADYLAGKGVSAGKMTVKGMGESAPVADNATKAGRAMNRRVEIMTK